MRPVRTDRQPHESSMSPRTHRWLAVWALPLLLFAAAGCSSDSPGPIQPAGDVTAPTVSSTNPANGAVNAAIISASFSEPMRASSLTGSTFVVKGAGGLPVPGTVSYDGNAMRATFRPASPLAVASAYTATISTRATDLAGNALVAEHTWSFTTGNAFVGQGNLPLGAAGLFAVLAGSTITSTGASIVTGDMGVSPGSVLGGFPPGTLHGSPHVADVAADAAKLALTVAYNDAAGRTQAPVSLAGNIGGLTLPPGLYKSTSSLQITSGDLTLDAQGDANAMFIFQVATTLTTTAGRAVILSGGARASNVFWQVGTSATLGTTSAFKGTIMADQSISLNTGASLDGRALARIGAVTLAGNVIVRPAN